MRSQPQRSNPASRIIRPVESVDLRASGTGLASFSMFQQQTFHTWSASTLPIGSHADCSEFATPDCGSETIVVAPARSRQPVTWPVVVPRAINVLDEPQLSFMRWNNRLRRFGRLLVAHWSVLSTFRSRFCLQFITPHVDVAWSVNPNPHSVRPDSYHRYGDVVSDQNLAVRFPR